MTTLIRLTAGVLSLRTRSSPALVAAETHTSTMMSYGCYNQETTMKKVKTLTFSHVQEIRTLPSHFLRCMGQECFWLCLLVKTYLRDFMVISYFPYKWVRFGFIMLVSTSVSQSHYNLTLISPCRSTEVVFVVHLFSRKLYLGTLYSYVLIKEYR